MKSIITYLIFIISCKLNHPKDGSSLLELTHDPQQLENPEQFLPSVKLLMRIPGTKTYIIFFGTNTRDRVKDNLYLRTNAFFIGQLENWQGKVYQLDTTGGGGFIDKQYEFFSFHSNLEFGSDHQIHLGYKKEEGIKNWTYGKIIDNTTQQDIIDLEIIKNHDILSNIKNGDIIIDWLPNIISLVMVKSFGHPDSVGNQHFIVTANPAYYPPSNFGAFIRTLHIGSPHSLNTTPIVASEEIPGCSRGASEAFYVDHEKLIMKPVTIANPDSDPEWMLKKCLDLYLVHENSDAAGIYEIVNPREEYEDYDPDKSIYVPKFYKRYLTDQGFGHLVRNMLPNPTDHRPTILDFLPPR